MKRMLLISTFLIGICFNHCLAWSISGIKNELNDDVDVQLVRDDIVLSLDRVPAETLQIPIIGGKFTPIECPVCEWFTSLVKNGQPSIKEYLLITVGQKRFIICEGGHVESSYNTTEICKNERGAISYKTIPHCEGMCATWVCEIKLDPHIKVLALTAGLDGTRVLRNCSYVLKLSLLKTRRHSGFREDIVFDLCNINCLRS
ncbi:MAG: hypothetical protein V1646_02990 [bacterium]